MGIIERIDETGDTKLEWDKDVKDEVNAARKTFDDLKAKGYQAYEMDRTKKGDKIDKFDPDIERPKRYDGYMFPTNAGNTMTTNILSMD